MSLAPDSDLLSLAELDRARFARRLHDTLSQDLTAVSTAVFLAKDGGAGFDRLQLLVEQTVSNFRFIMAEATWSADRRPFLEDALNAWGQALLRWKGFQLRLRPGDASGQRELADPLLLRAIKEATINSARHSGEQSGVVGWRRDNDRLIVEVADSGRGFDPSSLESRPGLDYIAAVCRIGAIQLEINSDRSRGTELRFLLPAGDLRDSRTLAHPMRRRGDP
jgi:signal transduction histidine kinase